MAISNPNASIRSPQDLVNNALVRIGYKKRIGDLYDGSAASSVALDIYAQTRDQLLFMNDWDFSERNLDATLLKSAPQGGYIPPTTWNPAVNPPLPWFYEYAYPGDALKIRSVRGQPLFVINFDPQPNIFSVENDSAYNPAQRVILSNVPSALIVYTARVVDLTTWNDDAVEAFAAALGRRLAPALTSLQTAQMAAGDEAKEQQDATMERPT